MRYGDCTSAVRGGSVHGDHGVDAGGRVNVKNEAVSALAGGALALYGLAGRRSLFGGVLVALGSSLLYRGITGHCPMYNAFGIDTAAARSSPPTSSSKHPGIPSPPATRRPGRHDQHGS
jgi:hypothetical protein